MGASDDPLQALDYHDPVTGLRVNFGAWVMLERAKLNISVVRQWSEFRHWEGIDVSLSELDRLSSLVRPLERAVDLIEGFGASPEKAPKLWSKVQELGFQLDRTVSPVLRRQLERSHERHVQEIRHRYSGMPIE